MSRPDEGTDRLSRLLRYEAELKLTNPDLAEDPEDFADKFPDLWEESWPDPLEFMLETCRRQFVESSADGDENPLWVWEAIALCHHGIPGLPNDRRENFPPWVAGYLGRTAARLIRPWHSVDHATSSKIRAKDGGTSKVVDDAVGTLGLNIKNFKSYQKYKRDFNIALASCGLRNKDDIIENKLKQAYNVDGRSAQNFIRDSLKRFGVRKKVKEKK